jgi:hypothetical protein
MKRNRKVDIPLIIKNKLIRDNFYRYWFRTNRIEKNVEP